MSVDTTSTATAVVEAPFPQLSLDRVRRLSWYRAIAMAVIIGAAVLAWLVIYHWAPNIYLPQGARYGLRAAVFGILYAGLLGWFVARMWTHCAGHIYTAGTGQHTVVPVFWLPLAYLGFALTVPIWPIIGAAWTTNNPTILTSSWLPLVMVELPVAGLLAVALITTDWLDRMHTGLDIQQINENRQTSTEDH